MTKQTLEVYQAEVDAGIASVIKQNNTLACLAQVVPASTPNKDLLGLCKTQAAIDDMDLYPVRSILVSSNWNANDDVFAAEDLWEARQTPTHKPTNLEHDDDQLVGHITATCVIDDKGDAIAEKPEEFPQLIHLVDDSVIYRNRSNPEVSKLIEELIAEIEDGTKYVSMECLFYAYDYAVMNPDKTYSVIKRDETTATLSQHLRAYGGTGYHDGLPIGRLVRGMIFSGKGFVDSPANKNSVILTVDDNKDDAELTTISSEVVDASDNETENLMSEAKIKELEDALAQANDKLAKVDIAKFEAKASELADTAAKLTEERDAATAELAELTKANTQLSADIEAAKAATAEVEAAKAELELKIEAAEKQALLASRVSSLVDGGLDKAVAEEKVALFEYLTDAQFEDIAKAFLATVETKVSEETKAEAEEVVAEDIDKEDAETEKSAEAAVEEIEEVKEPETVVASAKEEVEDSVVNRFELARQIRNK